MEAYGGAYIFRMALINIIDAHLSSALAVSNSIHLSLSDINKHLQ